MDQKEVLKLAIESLERKRVEVEVQLAQLRSELGEEYTPDLGSVIVQPVNVPKGKVKRNISPDKREAIVWAQTRRWYRTYLYEPNLRPQGWERNKDIEARMKKEGSWVTEEQYAAEKRKKAKEKKAASAEA